MGNPWRDRRVLNYAHQGGAREAPSSTLFAIRQAIAAGADAVELDVHATLDGQLVVCHDATVDRTTAGFGAIPELSLAQLRTLDNAHWWVPGYESLHDAPAEAYVLRGRHRTDPSLGIATLAEVLDEFADVFINLDIKETAPNVAPYEHLLADVLRAYGRTDDVIVSSFHDDALETFRRCATDVHTSLGISDSLAFGEAAVAGAPLPRFLPTQVALQLPHTYGEQVVIDAALVEAAHRADLAVHAWTIDVPEEMRQLIDIGVDGIMTDCPSVLNRVLGETRSGWRNLAARKGGQRPSSAGGQALRVNSWSTGA